jgi:putative sigma-54 modulation protein
MKLIVTGRHVEVVGAARQDIDKKLRRLERLLGDSAISAQCVVWRERADYVCELTVHARGDHMLHGLGRGSQIPPAVSQAVTKVAKQAQKMKDRWKTRKRAGGNGLGALVTGLGEAPAIAEPSPRVIRSKRYAVKPMSLDDALLTLAGGEESFLVFRHAASDNVAILFRRHDGHFGLIEPEA